MQNPLSGVIRDFSVRPAAPVCGQTIARFGCLAGRHRRHQNSIPKGSVRGGASGRWLLRSSLGSSEQKPGPKPGFNRHNRPRPHVLAAATDFLLPDGRNTGDVDGSARYMSASAGLSCLCPHGSWRRVRAAKVVDLWMQLGSRFRRGTLGPQVYRTAFVLERRPCIQTKT